jgi:hypothetical protein
VGVGGAPAPTRPEDRIDWAQVRLLLATNWRVWLNRLATRKAALVLNLVLVVTMTGFAVFGNAALGLGISWLRSHRPDLAASAVHEVFLTVFFIIVVTPVLGFRGNEFLDVTKLFTFPVGHRTVFAATLFGLMGSGSVLFFCLPLVAAVIGFGGPLPSVLAGIVAALLLVLCAVALGQFLLLAFLNTLKSRKWRDVTMVVVPLVVGGMYVAFSVMQRREGRSGAFLLGSVEWFDRWRDWTLPLPSWWAAEVATGQGFVRFVPVLALVALTAWLVRASAVLQEKAFLGDVDRDAETGSVSQRGFFAPVTSRMPGRVGALVEKEIAILRREPAVRSILIGQAMYPIVWCGLGAWQVVSGSSPEKLGRLVPLAGLIAYPLLLMELGLVMNLLGLEGGGAVHAMLLPVKRRTLLLGKDVAYLLVFGTLNAVVAVALTVTAFFVTPGGAVGWGGCAAWSLAAALEGYCVVAIGLGIGNLMSVVNPMRVAVRDRRAIRQQVGGRDGCLRNLIGVAAVMGSLFLAVPLAASFHLPYALKLSGKVDPPAWLPFVTVPFGVALSAGVMLAGAALGGSLLSSREEDIVARLAKSDE